jgi:hypothetical protein
MVTGAPPEGIQQSGPLANGPGHGPNEGLQMSVDLSGSHPDIDVEDKLKTYAMFHALIKYGSILVIAILAFMAFFLVH